MTEPSWYFVRPLFEAGMTVVVGEGPFQGLRATVLGADQDDHLIVQVALLQGFAPVALDASQVSVDCSVGHPQLVTH
jgi:transcription antitermination factor NusG